jgi:NADPH-dependent 2,4-dienoyl-CoA reductase/sulfur reductase-like enzyme
VLTNQECRVRDVRNPVVSCTVEPSVGLPDQSARATNGPFVRGDAAHGLSAPGEAAHGLSAPGDAARPVLVVGGGPAGLEGARTLALAGHRVRLVDRADRLGGLLPAVAGLPGRHRFARFAAWLEAEVRALGVAVELGVELGGIPDGPVLVATGAGPSPVLAALADPPPGPVVIDDPLGDGAAVALAEALAAHGRAVALVTPDPVAGKALARTGDLVDANTRLQRAGVDRVLESAVVAIDAGTVTVADVVTGERRMLPCASLIDARPRPAAPIPSRPVLEVAGDAVAPRTVHQAVREGREAAARLIAATTPGALAPSGRHD